MGAGGGEYSEAEALGRRAGLGHGALGGTGGWPHPESHGQDREAGGPTSGSAGDLS